MYIYDRPRAGLGQAREAVRHDLRPLGDTAQGQRQGDCSGWMSDLQSFSKVVADHFVRTEYPDLVGRAVKIWCAGDKKFCQVDYSTGIKVVVSFVNLPDHVVAGSWMQTNPIRCEYDFDCSASGKLVLRKRSCKPN